MTVVGGGWSLIRVISLTVYKHGFCRDPSTIMIWHNNMKMSLLYLLKNGVVILRDTKGDYPVSL